MIEGISEESEAAAVRKAEEDWSKLCKFIEKMELTSEEAPTEEVRKSEEFEGISEESQE